MATADVIAHLRVEGQQAFSQAMSSASRSAKGAQEGVAQSGEAGKRGAAGLVKAALAAGAVYKGFGMLKDSVSTTVDLAKSTAAFSRASGLDAKTSGAWVTIAKQRGIETRQLQMGMATFGRTLGAVGGSGKAGAEALGKLGLSQKQLIGMPMNERMSAVADAFSRMPDGVEKAALAQRLFGRSGQQLIPILNEGGAALGKQLDAAGKLVPVTASSQAQALKAAQAQREWGMATMGLKMAVGTALIPILTGLAKLITPIAGAFARAMQSSAAFRVGVFALAIALGALLVIGKLATLAGLFVTAIKLVGGAFVVLNAILWANPILLIVAAVIALGAAFYLLYTKVAWFREAVNAVFEWLKNAVSAVVSWVGANWKLLAAIFLAPIAPIVSAYLLFPNQIRGAFNTVVGIVKGAVSAVVGALMSLPGKMASVASSTINALTSGFGAAFNRIWSIGWKLVETIVSGIKAGARAVYDAVKSIIPDVGGMVGEAVGKVKGAIGLATGGLVAAQAGTTLLGGGRQLVGERGPELANFPAGTRITPLPPPALLPSQLAGAGGGQVVVPVYLDRRQIALAMGSYSADTAAAR